MFRSLALLSSFAQLRALEDFSALFQQRQTMNALEVSSFEESEEALPDIGADGIRVSRLSSSVEPGSSFLLNYSHFCEQEDAFGPKECALYYDMPIKQVFSAFINGGLKSGDVLYESFNVQLEHNESNFWSFLVPKSFLVEARCEFCQNSCMWSEVKQTHSLKLTVPTILEHPAVCNDSAAYKTQQQFTFINTTSYWPKPPAALGLKGNITSTTAVYDKDGNSRVAGSYIFRMAAPTPPAMLAAKLGLADEDSKPADPISMLRDMLVGPFDDLIEKASEAAGGAMLDPSALIKKFAGNGSHVLVLNFTVKSLSPGSSISINFDKGCTATDGLGSFACEFAYGDGANISTALDISYTAVEGSNLYTSSKINIGGNLGLILGDKLSKKKESVTPLCGASQVSLLQKKGLSGLSRSFKGMKCGDYRLEYTGTAQEFTNQLDIQNFAIPRIPLLPFLPKTFDELLPVTMVKEMKLRNADNSTITAIEVAVGLKTA